MNKSYLIILVLLFSIVSCQNGEKESVTIPTIRPVKYTTVGNKGRSGMHSYTGIAKAQDEANLSFKVGGTINKIYVKVGDVVRKGQLLATLDPTDYQVGYDQSLANVQSAKAQIESAMANLESANANYVSAQSNYQRFEKLYETNSISLSDFEQSKATYQSAEAAFKAAQTQVEAAKAGKKSSDSMAKSASNQVVYTKIKAPFEGIITMIYGEPNEMVGQGSPMIEINSTDNPDVEIGVPENTISEIKANQPVSVKFNSVHDDVFEGFVHEIGYRSSGSTYPITIRLKTNDERIRPGMPANAIFKFDDHHSDASALLVPASAVGEDGKGNFIYAIKPNGDKYQCKKQQVEVGMLSDAGFEIKSGLKQGDMVATAGLNVLSDGMEVVLYKEK